MATSNALKWDQTGEKFFETGVKNCALYVMDGAGAYSEGVAWNGITAINENPSGGESTPLYADDTKYLNLLSNEEFGATIEAYTYPEEFEACDGTAQVDSTVKGLKAGQQERKTFGLAYKTTIGNDINNNAGYKLHIIYGCLAAPSSKGYQTINDSPEAITFSWEVSTTPVEAAGLDKPTATLVIDSTQATENSMAALEAVLFGGTAKARLPLPDEIVTIMKGATSA